jgi:hypothetical protein
MVTKTLITELKKARDLFDWTLVTGDMPPVERRRSQRLRVRGRLKKQPDQGLIDPIGAVCFSRTGIFFSEQYWVEAALSIGLSMEDARDIIAAANDMTWRTVGSTREPDPNKIALRESLINATRPVAEVDAVSK